MLRFLFSISTLNADNVEKASEALADFFGANYQYDTIIIPNISNKEAAQLVLELYSEEDRSSDLDYFFDTYGIVVKGVSIDSINNAKNSLRLSRSYKESYLRESASAEEDFLMNVKADIKHYIKNIGGTKLTRNKKAVDKITDSVLDQITLDSDIEEMIANFVQTVIEENYSDED